MSSISTRLKVSFLANIARSGLSFLTVALLARWCGPVDYGRMSFLFTTFTLFCGLLDMGSSSAFFTLLSRRTRSRQFISIYWRFIGIQLVSGLLLLLILLPDSMLSALWHGESRFLIALGFVAAFMQGTVWNLAMQMAESNRETVNAQKINVSTALFHLGLVITLALSGQLSIQLVFISIILEFAISAWWTCRLYSICKSLNLLEKEELVSAGSVFREFFHYCRPLMPVVIIGFVHDFSDRWMLQSWGGAEQQAFFSVAQQFSAVVLIATASISRVIWKEIAEAHERKDIYRVHQLFQRSSRLLFFVGSALAGALVPSASEILGLLFGQNYLNGSNTLSIMLLYPVHQSIGQINGMMMFATGKTKEYSIASILIMIVSLLVLYFVLAPTSLYIPGFQLGAEGLAIKQVSMQIISVNVLGYLISRIFGWKFDWMYQIFSLLGCLILGWVAYIVTSAVVGDTSFILLKFSIMGLLYASLLFSLVFYFPQLLSFTNEELKERVGKLVLLKRDN